MKTTQLEKEQNYCKMFNERFKEGDRIEWRKSIYGKYETVTIDCEAFMSFGNAVVFFNEVFGYCSVSPDFVKY